MNKNYSLRATHLLQLYDNYRGQCTNGQDVLFTDLRGVGRPKPDFFHKCSLW